MTWPFPVLLLVMAAAALFCRFAGFLAMRFLPITPRVEAALRATPLSVMSAITAIALVQGGPVEWVALVAAVGLTFLLGNDVAAALLAVALAAALRWMTG